MKKSDKFKIMTYISLIIIIALSIGLVIINEIEEALITLVVVGGITLVFGTLYSTYFSIGEFN